MDPVSLISEVSTNPGQAHGTPTAHYVYDANGNRLAGPGLNSTPAYDAQDRLLSYGPCSYTYKVSGELQTKICADGTTTYDYDALGNLRHVTTPSGTNVEYLIDGQNRRVAKKINGAVVESFLYRNQLQPMTWLDGSGHVKAQFVYGTRVNVPEYMVVGTVAYRFITDQISSVRLVVNSATGDIAQRIDWDEFGNVLIDAAVGFQPFGFAGGLRDVDTGMTRFGARDYDSVTGRWTTRDPLGFGGALLNLYSYVGSDPINHADASGLDQTVFDCGLTSANGRNCSDGPRNGNWGGKNWSGGWNPRQHDGQDGPAPPLDSADECYMVHDKCYETPSCSSSNKSERKMAIRNCDLELVSCLARLADDPRMWPHPPRRGTEEDSKNFGNQAIWFFK